MKLDIDAELAVCEAATPGPYHVDVEYTEGWVFVYDSENRGYQVADLSVRDDDLETDHDNEMRAQAEHDADFIAHARTGYPEALRRLKRLRELIGPMIAMPAKTVDVTSGELFDSTLLCNEVDLREIRRLLCLGKENAPT